MSKAKKTDSAIIDQVDEELEEEVAQADLYTVCFFHGKALLKHYINCRKRRVPPEMKSPDRRLEELITNLKDHSANSHITVSDVILTDTKTALSYQPSQQDPFTGGSENLSSTAELSETQTKPVQSEVARVP